MHSINSTVYISIAGFHVSDSGLHLSAAASLPVQPSSFLSQNERSYTSKQPLEASESKRKEEKTAKRHTGNKHYNYNIVSSYHV